MNPHHDFDAEYMASVTIRFLGTMVVFMIIGLVAYNVWGV